MEKKNHLENMLKGRMAESLFEELLKKSGNKVYRFGYEAILQNLTQIQRSFDIDSETGYRIRAIPDFVVVNHKGETDFVEVKFRWSGKLHKEDHERLKRIRSYWQAKLVVVNCLNEPYFRVSRPPYFNKEDKFCSRSVLEESSWNIKEEDYKEYEVLVEKYLKLTLVK